MSANIRSNLVFIGFRGTGKSTLSTECAKKLGWKRVSTDERVTERLGMTIAEYVNIHGWAAFRAVEHEEIRALQGIEQAIIDCGGGVVENPENMRLLGLLGEIIWIDAALEDVLTRLLENSNDVQRPLLSQGDMHSDVEQNYTRRAPMYRQYAQHRINTSSLTIEHCTHEILRIAESRMKGKSL
jgi:shikimate kinase